MRNPILALVAVAGLTACSSSMPDVETVPRPETQTIPGTGDAGSEPARKNDTASENASTAARFGIPPGHLPPPGQCRVWIPGEAPGKQKKYKSGACESVADDVPAGAWLVYRPGEDKKEVVVREYGQTREVVSVRVFDIVTGAMLRELDPAESR